MVGALATKSSGSEFTDTGEHPGANGPGSDLGDVVLEDGSRIPAGRVMMRDTWNAAVHDPLLPAFEAGKTAPRPDVLVHKNRNSGLWNDGSALNEYLDCEGIRTLLFAGANTDQCVLATLLDAQARGFDTVFLKDGCGTDSPGFAQKSVEYNCRKCLGFMSSCRGLARAAELSSVPDVAA